MQYVLIAFVLMVLCLFGLSCRKSTPENPPEGGSTGLITVASGRYFSRTDIQQQLAMIAESPPPKNLAMGAMCYDIAGPPPRIDYVCPDCGEKTLYALDSSADEQTRQRHWKSAWTLGELESLRRLTRQINALNIALDESQFCSHCTSDVKDPRLGLVIRYHDRPEPHRVWEVNWTDLAMIKAATEFKLKYKGQQDNEVALKENLPRLEELLGVKLDDTDKVGND